MGDHAQEILDGLRAAADEYEAYLAANPPTAEEMERREFMAQWNRNLIASGWFADMEIE